MFAGPEYSEERMCPRRDAPERKPALKFTKAISLDTSNVRLDIHKDRMRAGAQKKRATPGRSLSWC